MTHIEYWSSPPTVPWLKALHQSFLCLAASVLFGAACVSSSAVAVDATALRQATKHTFLIDGGQLRLLRLTGTAPVSPSPPSSASPISLQGDTLTLGPRIQGRGLAADSTTLELAVDDRLTIGLTHDYYILYRISSLNGQPSTIGSTLDLFGATWQVLSVDLMRVYYFPHVRFCCD